MKREPNDAERADQGDADAGRAGGANGKADPSGNGAGSHGDYGGKKWRDASPAHPCVVCKNTKWCSQSVDGIFAMCRRQGGGDGKEKKDRNGDGFWIHRLVPRPEGPHEPPRYTMADGTGERAEPDVLHKVYTKLLGALQLSHKHREDLAARGFKGNPQAAGFRTLDRCRLRAVRQVIAAGLEKYLPGVPGFFIQAKDGRPPHWSLAGWGGLLVPVRDPEGRVVALLLRLDEPKDPKSKYNYVSSKGKRGGVGPGSPVHVPLFVGDRQTVRVTEGALKSDVATSASGMLTVGLPGVGAWRRAAPVLHQLGAKTARVAYDADCRTNRNVAEPLGRLVEDLRKGGFVVELEIWDGADGKGIDDLLAGGKTPKVLTDAAVDAELGEVLKAAHEADPAPPDATAGDTEALDDPHRLARLYLLSQQNLRAPGDRLRYYREMFWEWNGSRYDAIPDKELDARLTKFIKRQLDEDFVPTDKAEVVPKVTPHVVLCVRGALAGERLVPLTTAQPSWLGELPAERSYVAVRNGLLDVDAFLAGSGDPLRPHDPSWFSATCLPYDFDPRADCPKWRAFLKRNLGGDDGKARLLQQWAGYLLLHDTSLQRFLMMIGDGANGKSVVCAVLMALLGEDNVSTVPLEFFGEKFRLFGTLGKLANVVPEVGELDKMAEGQIKAFVVGDPLEFERKYKQPFTARPTARLTLAANNPPHFSDKTDGIWRRAMLFPFTVQIPVEEQIAGMDKPDWWRKAGEMPGVFLWALAGLYDLRRKNQFAVPDSCREAAEKLRVESNAPRRFLLDHYAAGDGAVSKQDIYKEYAEWCRERGHHAMADIGFGREVRRLFPAVKDGKMAGEFGKRVNCYDGLVRKFSGD